MTKLIFGCGYLGFRTAKLWLARGETVYAVTRSAKRADELAEAGIQPLILDITSDVPLSPASTSNPGEPGKFPADIDTVLFAVGYDRASGQAIDEVYVGGLARVLAALPESVERFVYISSTGVYGNIAGDLVDECTPCHPILEVGKACLAAEQLLRSHTLGTRCVILRLAGIYGPGRIPRGKDLLAGLPIDAPAAGYLNLIHVDDAARIILLAEQSALLPSLYVVSDGQPVQRSEYYCELARLLGAPAPRFVAPAPNSLAQLRAGSDKRVHPTKLMHELSPTLLYASYREGLAAIVASASA